MGAAKKTLTEMHTQTGQKLILTEKDFPVRLKTTIVKQDGRKEEQQRKIKQNKKGGCYMN